MKKEKIFNYSFLTKEQLNKLATKRLLSLYKSARNQYHKCYYSDIPKFEKYLDEIKSILNKREHIDKK